MNMSKSIIVEEGRILSYCLVEAFLLKSYLHRPYPDKNGLTPEQVMYNHCLNRAWRMIENTFNTLVSPENTSKTDNC